MCYVEFYRIAMQNLLTLQRNHEGENLLFVHLLELIIFEIIVNNPDLHC